MLLKNYLDKRVRKHRLLTNSRQIRSEQVEFDDMAMKDAKQVWAVIRNSFITRQDSNMEEAITIKLTDFPDGYFYYSDKKYYKKPEDKDIVFSEQALKLILILATAEGITISRKEKQEVFTMYGHHLHSYGDKLVYEFTYTPPID